MTTAQKVRTVEIAGFTNSNMIMRSCLGNVRAELAKPEPNVKALDNHAQKFCVAYMTAMTGAFRYCAKNTLPLSLVRFPKKHLATWREAQSIPELSMAIAKRSVRSDYTEDGILIWETFKYGGIAAMHDWMKFKGEAFRKLNSGTGIALAAIKLETANKATQNLSFNAVASNLQEASAAVQLYITNTHRPAYSNQAQTMYNIIGRYCLKCGSTDNLSCDHVIPKSKRCDLAKSIINMQPLCLTCNNSKNTDFVDYRSAVQKVALFTTTHKYKVPAEDIDVMIHYVEYGLTREQLGNVLNLKRDAVNQVLVRHDAFLVSCKEYIQGRRYYRRAYEELGNKTENCFA